MSGLGIFGGIGRGVSSGIKQMNDMDRDKQEKELRDYQLRQAKRQEQEQSDIKSAADSANSEADRVRSKDGARTAGIQSSRSQSDADSAAAQDTSDAIVNSTPASDMATNLAGGIGASSPTPSVTELGATAPAASLGSTAAPAGIAGRMANLGATQARASSAAAPVQGMSDEQNHVETWAKTAGKMADVYMKYGQPDMAEKLMKTANDSRVAMYARQWQSAMQDLYSGNDQAGAAKLATLYNMSYPDGKYVDVQPAGNGTFKVTQYDEKTGQPVSTNMMDRNAAIQLGRTYLSPDQMVKLMVEDERTDRSDKREDKRIGAQNRAIDSRERMSIDRDARLDARDQQRHEEFTASQARLERQFNAMIADRRDARDDKTDKAEKKDSKKTQDTELKAVRSEVLSLSKSKAGVNPDILTTVGDLAEQGVRSGMGAADAAKTAWDAYDKANKESSTEAAAQTKSVTDKAGVFKPGTAFTGDGQIERDGDQELVKTLKDQGKFSAANYQKALAEKIRRGKLGGQSQSTPAVQKAQKGEQVFVDRNGVRAVKRNGQYVVVE
jgi:hypothetical protein